jgi:hypothetical protein
MKILRQTISAKIELKGKRARESRRREQTWETRMGLNGAVAFAVFSFCRYTPP